MIFQNLLIFNFILRGDVIAFESGDYEKIIKEYKNSVLYYEAVINYSFSLIEKGEYLKALRVIESYEDNLPNYLLPRVLDLKKRIYKVLDRESYMEILKELLKSYPNFVEEKELNLIKDMEFYKGKYYLFKEEWDKSIYYFINSKESLKYYYIGYAYFKKGEPERALFYLDKVGKENKRWYYERAKILRGLCYKYRGDIENSLKEFFSVSHEYDDLRELAMKEARLVMLENAFYPSEMINSSLTPEEKIFIDYDMDIPFKVNFDKEMIRKEKNIFLLYLLAEKSGDDKIYNQIKKIDPLSLFSVKEEGICYKEDFYVDNFFDENPLILAYLDLGDAFKDYIEKMNDFGNLLTISQKLYEINKFFYSVYAARKAYFLIREEENVCFSPQLLKLLFPTPYREIVFEKAREKNINPYLVYAIMRRESMFNERAVSPKGARGLMQIMPEAFKKIENYRNFPIDSLFNPKINIDAGVEILSNLIDSLGETYLAVAAYNAGIYKVREWMKKGIIKNEFQFLMDCPFEETRKYTFRVLSDYEVYKKLYYE